MKLTMLGSGVRTPLVMRGLAAGQDDLDLEEIVLHDTDVERMRLMTELGRHLCAEWGARFSVRADRRSSLRVLGDPTRPRDRAHRG